MKKKSLLLLPLLVAVWTYAPAQTVAPPAEAASAPEPAPAPFTGNINLTTNYKFRGQDQGTGKGFSPAVQGGFDWSQSGFYLGNWNSNISFAGNIEMDFYGGYKGELAKDLGYDVGILQYYYPKRGGDINFNTTELYGALSYQWLSLKYSHTVSTDYFGLGKAELINAANNGTTINRPKGRNTFYLDLSGNYPVIDKWTINGHVGYTRLASDLRNASYQVFDEGGCDPCTVSGFPSYFDWKIGATYDLGSGFSVAGAVVGASKKSYYGEPNSTRAILTLSKSM